MRRKQTDEKQKNRAWGGGRKTVNSHSSFALLWLLLYLILLYDNMGPTRYTNRDLAE